MESEREPVVAGDGLRVDVVEIEAGVDEVPQPRKQEGP